MFTADDILRATHHLVYPQMQSIGGPDELSALRRVVKEVLLEPSRNDLAGWIRRIEGGRYQFTKTLTTDEAALTRQRQALLRSSDEALARLGAPPAAASIEPARRQLEFLFGEDGEVDEDDDPFSD